MVTRTFRPSSTSICWKRRRVMRLYTLPWPLRSSSIRPFSVPTKRFTPERPQTWNTNLVWIWFWLKNFFFFIRRGTERQLKQKKDKYQREHDVPHRAAHRISELKRFLYLRISGVSLWGLMLVGLTLTTEIFRASFSLACSWRNNSLANIAAEVRRQENTL